MIIEDLFSKQAESLFSWLIFVDTRCFNARSRYPWSETAGNGKAAGRSFPSQYATCTVGPETACLCAVSLIKAVQLQRQARDKHTSGG